MIQGDAEWRAARCGKITGSRFRAVMDLNRRTGKPNASRRALVETLRKELLFGVPEEVEENEYMAHGKAMEPRARGYYEFLNDCECAVPALMRHLTIPYIAYSPDGLVGKGMIEIKSPFLEARHLRTVESKSVPDDYLPQVQGGMWVCEREWCDYISYFPEISVEIIRVYRDDKYIERLANECEAVWNEVNQQRIAA